MADIITLINDDKQEIKNQLGSLPDTFPVPQFFEDGYTLGESMLDIQLINFGNSMIWGSSEFGIWGTSEWGVDATSAVLLDSTIFGYLDNCYLNDTAGDTLVQFVLAPTNNKFTDHFDSARFVDGSATTAALDIGAKTVTFTTGQILQSAIVAKIQGPINNVKFGAYPTSNCTIAVSNDDGGTWHTVSDPLIGHTFATTTSNDELKYKITATAALVINTPIVIFFNQ